MARRQPAPAVRPDTSATSATILPGVALPAWAYGPAAAEPEPEPAAAVAPEPEPEPELVAAGPVAAAVGAGAVALAAPASAAPAPAPAFAAPAPVSPPVAPATPAVPAPAVPDAGPASPVPPVQGPAEPAEALPAPAAGVSPIAQDLLPPESARSHGRRAKDTVPGSAGTDKSRRPLLLVAGIVVVVLLAAFAAFVTPGFLVSGSDSDNGTVATPTVHVVLPATVAGRAKAAGAAALNAAATRTLSGLGVSPLAAATYAKAGAPTVTLAAGVAPASAAARATYFARWHLSAAVTKPVAAPTGKAGVTAQCGTANFGGKAAGVCVFLGPQLAGTLSVPGASAAQAASLLPAVVSAPVAR